MQEHCAQCSKFGSNLVRNPTALSPGPQTWGVYACVGLNIAHSHGCYSGFGSLSEFSRHRAFRSSQIPRIPRRSESIGSLPRAWMSMLRIRMLSGEELASAPVEDLSNVRELKQTLHQLKGMPPRFRQRLLLDGASLADSTKLEE